MYMGIASLHNTTSSVSQVLHGAPPQTHPKRVLRSDFALLLQQSSIRLFTVQYNTTQYFAVQYGIKHPQRSNIVKSALQIGQAAAPPQTERKCNAMRCNQHRTAQCKSRAPHALRSREATIQYAMR